MLLPYQIYSTMKLDNYKYVLDFELDKIKSKQMFVTMTANKLTDTDVT